MCNVESSHTARDEFNAAIERHLEHYYWDSLGLYDWRLRIASRKAELVRARANLRAIEQTASFDFSGKRVLDIGCGWGGNVVAAAQMGAVSTGCDIDAEVLEVARLRGRVSGVSLELIESPAEKLAFADNEFDYVQSVCVLEHVDHVERAVFEMVRVLKPGGIGFVHAPNYWLPVEPHYKILFPPKCPRLLAKAYLRLLARPCKFIDTVNYVDAGMLRGFLEGFGVAVTDIYHEYSQLAGRNYASSREPDNGSLPKVSAFSYNALACKVMGRAGSISLSLCGRFFGMHHIYFLFRKS